MYKEKLDSKSRPSQGRHLSALQLQTLENLKGALDEQDMLDEYRMDDGMLLSFLRYCKFDLEKTKEMVIAGEKWRKTFGLDDLVDNFIFHERASVSKYITEYYHKTDKSGHPVFIGRINPESDLTELRKITTHERLLKNYAVEYEKLVTERLPACSAAKGRRVSTCCIILDWGAPSYPMKNLSHIDAYVEAATKIKNERYPGTTGKVIFINMPWISRAAWTVIKLWKGSKMNKRAAILGSNYQKELLEHIAAENLPKELGGTCECVGGCSLSDAGPWNEDQGEKRVKV